MGYIAFFFFFALSIYSCRRNGDTTKKNGDRAFLFQRFNGKYKIVSSTASKPLDLNFDGILSINLKDELPDLSKRDIPFTSIHIFNDIPNDEKVKAAKEWLLKNIDN
jgi:hypothetical protein